MKALILTVALVLLAPSLALGGQIYGTLTLGDRPVEAGVTIEVVVAGKTYRAATDDRGSYSVHVRESGRGRLVVHYRGQQPDHSIASFKDPARYDFALQRKGDRWVLVRR